MGSCMKAPYRVNIIYGEEDFRRDEEIERVSSYVSRYEGAEITSIIASDSGVSEILSEAMTGSLFSTARHVIVRNAEELKPADAKRLLSDLTEGGSCPLPDGTFVSISWADRKFPPAGIKMPKAAGWVGLIECKKAYERDAREFMRAYASKVGLVLTDDAYDALISRLGTDLSLVSSEVDKLVTYLGVSVAQATGDDVRKAVGEAQHEGLSDLITAIAYGRSTQAMHMVRQFRESTEPRIPNQLMLASIASELRLMIRMQELLSDGLSVKEVVERIKTEKDLRAPSFILERTVNAASRLGPHKAARMLVRLGEADRQMKGGTALTDTTIGEDGAFDAAVVDLCSIAKGSARQ